MHTARSGATATYIPTIGKVLIAGGGNEVDMDSEYIYATAELYDPATGHFSPTGSMTAARSFATATLLPSGKVLIAGGEGCSDPKHCSGVAGGAWLDTLATAELYDPDTGRFSETGSMAAPRASATATLLSDGEVLLAGFASRAELYSWRSGRFTLTGHDVVFAPVDTATLLPNDKVLVTGGVGSPVTKLYDASSGGFTDISLALPAGTPLVSYQGTTVPRSGIPSSATLLSDGRVLLFDHGYLETYDPTTGACAYAGFISPAGEWDGPTAVRLADGTVLFESGGFWDTPTLQELSANAAVRYDPTSGSTQIGSVLVARGHETATLLPNGDVLIAGGEDDKSDPLASAELFKP